MCPLLYVCHAGVFRTQANVELCALHGICIRQKMILFKEADLICASLAFGQNLMSILDLR